MISSGAPIRCFIKHRSSTVEYVKNCIVVIAEEEREGKVSEST